MAERDEILEAIRETGGTVGDNGKIKGGNLSIVARKLGIARKTLHNRMKKLGLRGTSGRPKKRFRGRARGYAATAGVIGAVLGGAILLSKYGKREA